MKQIKGMQLGAVLAAILLLSMAFVPVVSAKADAEAHNLSDPVVVKALVDKLNKEGANHDNFFDNLSPEEQVAIIKAMKVDKIIVERTDDEVSIAVNEICNSPRIQEKAYNWLDMALWTYTQTISRCYDGSILTEASRTKSGEGNVFWWSFAGHLDSTESGGAGKSSYRAYTQGKFQNCVPGYCYEMYPYIDMIVYGDGDFWSDQGGGGTT